MGGQQGTKVHMLQGGDEQVIASGGKQTVESGGEIDIESGGALKIAGTAIASTAAEIDAVADMSAHVVAPATGNLTMTAAIHGNKILYYDDADGAIILEAATGTGYTYIIVFKTAFTGGTITCAGTDTLLGGCSGVDGDADGTAFGFMAVASDNTVTLNGVATGGIAGDHLIFRDVASGLMHVDGFLTFSGGSEATPFSAV